MRIKTTSKSPSRERSSIMNVTLDTIVELLKAISAILVPIVTFLVWLTAQRAKRSEEASIRNAESIKIVNRNVELLEKNTNSISERNQQIAMKLGITEGIAQERASVQANSPIEASPAGKPVPVSDERTAAAVEKVGEAIEKATAKGKE